MTRQFDPNGPPISAGEVVAYRGGGGVPRSVGPARCACGADARKGQRTCTSCHNANERKARAAGRRHRKSRARPKNERTA